MCWSALHILHRRLLHLAFPFADEAIPADFSLERETAGSWQKGVCYNDWF